MNLINALRPFAQFNEREVSCHTLILFLAIAQAKDGMLQAELSEMLSMSRSSVSRNCCLLSNKTQKNQRGMGLIGRKRFQYDTRLNVLTLTETGKHLYKHILDHL